MPSLFDRLLHEGFLNSPPAYLKNNTCYEVLTGSHAYGTNLKDSSDYDVYCVAIPAKEIIFPHLNDRYIKGFGSEPPKFDPYIQHHINYNGQKQYDLSVYGIVNYFNLCAENNPNVIDTLFVPMDCILYINQIGNIIRDNRRKFLHKGCYYKFRGYCLSQLHKMSSNKREGKRKETYDKYGFDIKFAAHTLRLLFECEQILEEGDLDLRRNSELLKAVRNGEYTEAQVKELVDKKLPHVDDLYQKSKLPYTYDEKVIKGLLLNCLEHHFGSLDKCIVNLDKYELAIEEIKKIIANL